MFKSAFLAAFIRVTTTVVLGIYTLLIVFLGLGGDLEVCSEMRQQRCHVTFSLTVKPCNAVFSCDKSDLFQFLQ